jgi:3-hydroxyisobutyrate dehydrogenase-like beta-hydroxyacid dehydrogenase
MPVTTTDDRMLELLEKILRVQAIQAASGTSVTEGARLLKLAGLDNQTIADVLNTTAATVRSLTANLRTRRSRSRTRGR